MPTERPAQGTWLRGGRQKRARDADATGPADVIPFEPRAPSTPADPPTAATVRGGRVTTRRTVSSDLSMTLSINVDEIVSALVAEEQRLRAEQTCQIPHGRTRQREQAQHEPSSGQRAEGEASRAPDTPALDVLPHLYGRDPRRVARFQRDVQTNANFLLRGRAGALVSAIVGHDAPALKSLGDLRTYRTIMADGTWGWLLQAVRATRAYQPGLDAGLLLLRVIELHQPRLSQSECTVHRTQLYWFILDMLDRLDQWDAYLATWARVRAHTAETLTYQAYARQQHGTRLTPFILGEDAHGLTIHFLWLTLHRKELIERKVARQRRGQRVGNVKHATQEELSTDELRERLAWVARQARDDKSWG